MLTKEKTKKKRKRFLIMCFIKEITDVLLRTMQFYISAIYFSAI